jgi:hypothetical protein
MAKPLCGRISQTSACISLVVSCLTASPASAQGLRDLLGQLEAGDAVVLHVDRRGELMFVSFTLD